MSILGSSVDTAIRLIPGKLHDIAQALLFPKAVEAIDRNTRAIKEGSLDISLAIRESVAEVVRALNPTQVIVTGGGAWYAGLPLPTFRENGMADYVVKADHPDGGVTLRPVIAQDSEGNNIPLKPTTFVSDNPDAVELMQQEDGSFRYHIGAPGGAVLKQESRRVDTDEIVFMGADTFTIVPGDVAMVTGGGAEFEGLTPINQPEP